MNRLTRNTIAGVVGVSALVTVVIISPRTEPTPPPEMVQTGSVWQGDLIPGGATTFPISVDRSRYRLNLALITWPIDERAFANMRGLAKIDAANTFPVHVWRTRGYERSLVDTLRMPFVAGTMKQFPLGDAYQQGDVIDVEYLPMLVDVRLSSIDHRSGDQTGIPGTARTIGHVMAGDAGRRR